MNLEEIVDKIENFFSDTKERKCVCCRYKEFSKNMEKLQLSIEELNLIKAEFLEKTEYENNRFSKIFKPALVYIGAPVFATYITNYVQKRFTYLKDLWIGLFLLIIIFAVVYLLFGGVVACILVIIDSSGKNAKEKQLIRFLNKYINEKNWKLIHNE